MTYRQATQMWALSSALIVLFHVPLFPENGLQAQGLHSSWKTGFLLIMRGVLYPSTVCRRTGLVFQHGIPFVPTVTGVHSPAVIFAIVVNGKKYLLGPSMLHDLKFQLWPTLNMLHSPHSFQLKFLNKCVSRKKYQAPYLSSCWAFAILRITYTCTE